MNLPHLFIFRDVGTIDLISGLQILAVDLDYEPTGVYTWLETEGEWHCGGKHCGESELSTVGTELGADGFLLHVHVRANSGTVHWGSF